MKVRTNLREALSDPRLLGKALQGDSWHAWRAVLLAAMGELLTDEELATFRVVTGRQEAPTGTLRRVDRHYWQARRQVPRRCRAGNLSRHAG